MKSIGFPRMHKEKNEKRDFLPEFFAFFVGKNCKIYLEEGYGKDMGYTKEDYLNINKDIIFTDHKECYKKDIVAVLRSPEYYEIDWMNEGSILLSMLHYPTRKKRLEKLKEKNIFAISLDSIRNDFMERIIVNYKDTAGNGMELAFKELSKSMDSFYSKSRGVINVSIMGTGMVGLYAAKSAAKFGCEEINNKIKENRCKGVIVKMLPRSITSDEKELKRIFKETDILVDATNRDDPSKYIIKNELIDYLKPHAIILDLTADPYLTDIEPVQVKAIEGIPTGNLDKTIIYPFDEIYDTIPDNVVTKNRRIVVSCNAWPGIKPKECMEVYGKQVMPIFNIIINKNDLVFNEYSDDYFERAIYRGTIKYFERYYCGKNK